LLALSNILTKSRRAMCERKLSEEELTIFDHADKARPDLTTQDVTKIKKVAKQLLTWLKELLVLG